MRESTTRKIFLDLPVGLHPAVSPALGGDVYASGLPFFTKTARFSSFHSLKEFLSFASCMQQVNLLRCRSVPMCRVVSITPPVVCKLPGGVDMLCGGHQSPIQGLSRALRWRFSHRSDQSPLRGQRLTMHIQPVTCLLRKSSSGAYRHQSLKNSYHLLI